VVVYLTVKHESGIAIGRMHGLVAERRKVDDFEADCAKRNVRRFEDALLVWPAVRDAFDGGLDPAFGGGASLMSESGNAAHDSSLSVYREGRKRLPRHSHKRPAQTSPKGRSRVSSEATTLMSSNKDLRRTVSADNLAATRCSMRLVYYPSVALRRNCPGTPLLHLVRLALALLAENRFGDLLAGRFFVKDLVKPVIDGGLESRNIFFSTDHSDVRLRKEASR
jgi:hypothetical protein